jgi:DNA-binding MarR family transcriptional regulator
MPETIPTTPELAGRMRTIVGRMSRGLRQAGGQADLSPSQYEVLGTVARRGDVRLSELASIEGINPTLLSRIIGKLEADGLLVRESDPDDRRAAHVVPTAQGRKRYEQIRSERTDALNLAIEALDEQEQQALAGVLPVLEALADSLRHRPE